MVNAQWFSYYSRSVPAGPLCVVVDLVEVVPGCDAVIDVPDECERLIIRGLGQDGCASVRLRVPRPLLVVIERSPGSLRLAAEGEALARTRLQMMAATRGREPAAPWLTVACRETGALIVEGLDVRVEGVPLQLSAIDCVLTTESAQLVLVELSGVVVTDGCAAELVRLAPGTVLHAAALSCDALAMLLEAGDEAPGEAGGPGDEGGSDGPAVHVSVAWSPAGAEGARIVAELDGQDAGAGPRPGRGVVLAGSPSRPLEVRARRIGPSFRAELRMATVHVLEGARDVAFTGGRLSVAALAVLDGVVLGGRGDVPGTSLVAEPSAVVHDLAGWVVFHRVSGARIIGDPQRGFVLVGIDSEASATEALEGATIEGVWLDGLSQRSLATANTLLHAAIVVPSLYRLPFWPGRGAVATLRFCLLWNPRWVFVRRRTARAVGVVQFREVLRDWSHQAQLVRILAGVAAVKGAPGGPRSKLAWSSYRLRQLTAPSAGERALLAAYRLIGYGERPGPALLLWAVGVLVATIVQLAGRGVDLSVVGLGRVLQVAAYWAVPSVVLINQPQLPDGVGGGLGHMLVHTLLAIPLLTGVLALRALIKAP